MTELTKKKIVGSVIWNALEKYSSQGIAFLVSIVMARLLTPSEYGILGIASVFISFSNIFINSGLSRALICKKECSIDDYCTVNWINIGVSLLCYGILYVSAPLISSFYQIPILKSALRVLTLSLIIGAVSGVSRTILSKEMKFKQMSFITLATSLFSGIIGIAMAYYGMGVWALIYQSVLSGLFSSIWIMWVSKFIPQLKFSVKSFKELFSFGAKILGSDIIWVIFNNIYPLIIGKKFNSQSVGYFTRASSYSTLVPSNFSGVLENVLFSAFSKLQKDKESLIRLYQKSITISSFFVFTGNFFLLGLAYPLILNVISAKWLPCVPLLQILCLSTLLEHINSINGRLLMVLGYPGIFLKMAAVTQPINLMIICISTFGGLIGLAWGSVVSSIIGVIYNCHLFKKVTQINPFNYLKESLKILIISGGIGVGAMLSFDYWLSPSIVNLLVMATVMFLLYIGCIKLMMPQFLIEIKNLK
ncbi:MAG: lipopolysaccharide biosynthesis protein [Coprobacter sp.]|nr:lipopolysaccharide biosynthesis protein [Coprobacter sp.]